MATNPARVVILSGPSGAGKSTVAPLLARDAGRPTVDLTTDVFYSSIATGYVAPHLEASADQNVVVIDTVVAAVAAYARGGYDVVVDGVVGTHFLPPFRRAARRDGWDLRYVVLRPGVETTLARGTARAEPELRDAAALRQVHGIFADLGDLEPHAVDTSTDSPEATAARLRTALDDGAYRLAEMLPVVPVDSRTDPPLRGDEPATLRGFLDLHRETLRRKTFGLDAAQLSATLPPSTMTLGGLLKHLAYVESHWFTVVLAGAEPLPPFDTADWTADRDWEWSSAAADSPASLRTLFDTAVAASDARLDQALADGGLDLLSAREHRHGGGRLSLRWILVHMIEEYARHNGHADLLREAIDGQVGE